MAPNLFASVQKWDIEFEIGPEMLKSIMEYMVSFKNEVYFKFFSNRIFIQVVSSDNTQYSEVNIDGEGVQNYNANIPEGLGLEERYKSFSRDEQIKYRNIYITGEGIHKRVYCNLIDKNPTTPLGELLMFLGKNPIKVRIDTLYEKKIEFVMQKGMFIWWRLMDPNNDDTKKVENMPKVVSNIRDDASIGKAILTMEPGLFKRIASIGGKVGKGGNAHTRALFEADINKGMMIASGDTLRGRVLKLGVLGSNISDYANHNDYSDFDKKESKEINEFASKNKEDTIEDNDDNEENFDSIIPTGVVRIEDEDERENELGKDTFTGTGVEDSGTGEVEELSFATSDDIYRGKNKYDKRREERKVEKKRDFDDDLRKEEKKKSSKKKEKEDENIMDEAITNDLSSAEVDVKTQMWLEIPFMTPILKLNGLAPIIIEMRNGKPLVILQRPYPSCEVMLSIAPRIETDDSD